MITPKEKAEKLVDKFYSKYNNVRKDKTYSQEQKRMALIAVDEIINYCCGDDVLFLHKVKEEIEKL